MKFKNTPYQRCVNVFCGLMGVKCTSNFMKFLNNNLKIDMRRMIHEENIGMGNDVIHNTLVTEIFSSVQKNVEGRIQDIPNNHHSYRMKLVYDIVHDRYFLLV